MHHATGQISLIGGGTSRSTCFCEVVPVVLRDESGNESHVLINVNLTASSTQNSCQQLNVELTMEVDPYFLFVLELRESAFHVLKNDQRLLVDFQSFPEKFVDLLRSCISPDAKPRYVATLNLTGPTSSSSSAGPAVSDFQQRRFAGQYGGGAAKEESVPGGGPVMAQFCIVETNQFKELTHLALGVMKGTDQLVKQHLASELRATKETERLRLRELTELRERHTQTEISLQEARQQCDALDIRGRTETQVLRDQHAEERRAQQEKSAAEALFEREALRKELEDLRRQTDTFREENAAQVAQLSEEQAARDRLAGRLEVAERENFRTSEEGIGASKELERLREVEKELLELKNASGTRTLEQSSSIALLQEQLKAKTELYDQYSGRVKGLEETTKGLQERLALSIDEIRAGNDIISKMREQLRGYRGRLKAAGLSDSLGRGEADDLMWQSELVQLREGAAAVAEERATHEAEMRLLKEKLAEGQQLLAANHEVIEYLNRQISVKGSKPQPQGPGQRPPYEAKTAVSLIENLSTRLVSQSRQHEKNRARSPLPEFPTLLEPVDSMMGAAPLRPSSAPAESPGWPKPPVRTEIGFSKRTPLRGESNTRRGEEIERLSTRCSTGGGLSAHESSRRSNGWRS